MPVEPTPSQIEIMKQIHEENPSAAKVEGLEGAVIGIARRSGQPSVLAIDAQECVDILVKKDGMSPEDAEEYLEFNVFSSWLGNDETPVFVDRWRQDADVVEAMDDRARVLSLLNEIWQTIPVDKRPKISDFNGFYRCLTQPVVSLNKRENKVGLVSKGSGVVGISTLSLIATITDVLVGKKLAAQIDDNDTIIGWTWYEKPGEDLDDGDPASLEIL